MDQQQALKLLLAGKSAVITGKAGSGKTYLLNDFIRQLRQRKQKVAITATTGLAATHLNGETIHRWSKIGILDRLPGNFFARKLSNKDRQRFLETDVLIIDEISMLHDYQFDMINQILKITRTSDEPFGGLQVVMSGDFFQLPPIRRKFGTAQMDIFNGTSGLGFVTDSLAFSELNPIVCYLETQYRQDDNDLTTILDAIRSGIVEEYEIKQLQARMGLKIDDDDVTNLHTTNVAVDKINQIKLESIKGDNTSFEMSGSGNQYALASLKKSVLAPEILDLKLDAFVMAVKNDQKCRYVNGSLGRVVDFTTKEGYFMPVVKFQDGPTIPIERADWDLSENEQTIARVNQFPLRLAYAITVHKAQGMTLDKARIDLTKAFTPGMGYVALSRVRRLNDLYLLGLNQMALTVAEEAQRLDEELKRHCRQYLAKNDKI